MPIMSQWFLKLKKDIIDSHGVANDMSGFAEFMAPLW